MPSLSLTQKARAKDGSSRLFQMQLSIVTRMTVRYYGVTFLTHSFTLSAYSKPIRMQTSVGPSLPPAVSQSGCEGMGLKRDARGGCLALRHGKSTRTVARDKLPRTPRALPLSAV
eukprot:scaffold230560_cov18-Prasinocladus_malaysianus.AAC.2